MRWFALLLFAASVCAEEPKRADSKWWALQPLQGKPGADLDAMIDARLQKAGLNPAKPADRATLLRRATFDLTGLPPTPAEIDAFVADRSPEAFEKVIDRLLQSTAYGERWARHWLDIVRFAESHGFEYDRLRDNAWPYRDYVIRSLNDDRPYAEFVRDHIAGDVLPGRGANGVIATGALVAGPYDQAGAGAASISVRMKAREDELEDLLGTVGQTFLGATINCARCHDHKFDPYEATDYYRLKAMFAGVYGGERPSMSNEEIAAQAGKAAKLRGELNAKQSRIATIESAARARIGTRPGTPAVKSTTPAPISRWAFHDGQDEIGGLHLTTQGGAKLANGRLILDGKKAFAESIPLTRDLSAKTLEVWLVLPTLDQRGGGALTIQTVDGALFDSIVFGEQKPRQWISGSNFFARTRDLNATEENAAPNALIHLAVVYSADGQITFYRNGEPHGTSYRPEGGATAKFLAGKAQVVFGLRHKGGGNANLHAEIEEGRLYDVALTREQITASYRSGVDRISPEELRRAMTEAERTEHARLETEANKLREAAESVARPAQVYAAKPRAPEPTLFLKRGEIDKPGDVMAPGTPRVVGGPPAVELSPQSSDADRRRALAEWLVHPANPLTWRVMVNRVWQHHFGDGIVRTPNDFGLGGELPTHPDLLDALTIEFRDGGGSLKKLHKRIMMTQAYQRGTAHDEKAFSIDGENRLLWRYAPRRLEAEAVRDTMLAISGKLNPQAGGPSVRPFRIETFNSAFYVLFDEDRPDLNRRSVYRMNVNSAKDPLLEVLDCPDPNVKTPRRTTTTTPLQALTMMNGPFVDRMATAFAARLEREADSNAERIVLAYRLAYGRSPTSRERDRAIDVVRTSGWRPVCWAILNSSELIYLK